MAAFDEFRTRLDSLVYEAEQEAVEASRERQRRAEAFRLLLADFDREADRLQADVIAPRVEYLAALFPNAVEPEYSEEENYRHRIHLRLGHCAEFPCTADITILIVHDADPGHGTVSFDYVILPAYVTEKYRESASRRVAFGASADADVASLLDTAFADFVGHYLTTRSTAPR